MVLTYVLSARGFLSGALPIVPAEFARDPTSLRYWLRPALAQLLGTGAVVVVVVYVLGIPVILSCRHARRFLVLASFSLRSAAHVAAYAPLRCSRKPRQNAELGGRVFLKRLAMTYSVIFRSSPVYFPESSERVTPAAGAVSELSRGRGESTW